MFDPKQIAASMLGYAPQFVLSRFSSVIMGVIAAYGVLLFFLGQPSFFKRVFELALVIAGGYGAARGVRYTMVRVVALIEGPDAAAAAAAPAVSVPSASPSTGASPRAASPTQKAARAGENEKRLD